MVGSNEQFAGRLSGVAALTMILVGLFLTLMGLTKGMSGLADSSSVHVRSPKDKQPDLTSKSFATGAFQVVLGSTIFLLGVSFPALIRGLGRRLDQGSELVNSDRWRIQFIGPPASGEGQSPSDSALKRPTGPPGETPMVSPPPIPAIMLRCRNCKSLNPEEALHCKQCGQEL